MPLLINNETTQDAYAPRLTLGPAPAAQQVNFLVSNNAVLAQLAAGEKNLVESSWGPEILIPPSTGSYRNVQGMRFRSAVAGRAAQVVAQLVLPEDPIPFGSTAYSSNLSSSGTVTPGVNSVQINRNGVLVGTEPILNFINTTGLSTAFVDVPGSTLINMTFGLDGWQSYAPTITSTGLAPAYGTSAVTGRYVQLGKLVVAMFTAALDATWNPGTGNYRWALPVGAAAFATASGNIHQGFGFHSAGGQQAGFQTTILGGGALCQMTFGATYLGLSTAVGAAQPWAWANGDVFGACLAYEAA